jgi:hypothetical protein
MNGDTNPASEGASRAQRRRSRRANSAVGAEEGSAQKFADSRGELEIHKTLFVSYLQKIY